MARRSTSTPRRATSPSAASPSASSTDSSPVTPLTPGHEAPPPPLPGRENPVSSPELEAKAEELVAAVETARPTRAGNTHAQLVALVNAVDAYARGVGSWDDLLYQLETAKALLGLTGG